MPTGVVDFFNDEKGFGFILPDDGSTQVFAHHLEILSDSYKTLTQGQKVSYTLGQSLKGPTAQGIKII